MKFIPLQNTNKVYIYIIRVRDMHWPHLPVFVTNLYKITINVYSHKNNKFISLSRKKLDSSHPLPLKHLYFKTCFISKLSLCDIYFWKIHSTHMKPMVPSKW